MVKKTKARCIIIKKTKTKKERKKGKKTGGVGISEKWIKLTAVGTKRENEYYLVLVYSRNFGLPHQITIGKRLLWQNWHTKENSPIAPVSGINFCFIIQEGVFIPLFILEKGLKDAANGFVVLKPFNDVSDGEERRNDTEVTTYCTTNLQYTKTSYQLSTVIIEKSKKRAHVFIIIMLGKKNPHTVIQRQLRCCCFLLVLLSISFWIRFPLLFVFVSSFFPLLLFCIVDGFDLCICFV